MAKKKQSECSTESQKNNQSSQDKTPRYTVKEVAELLGITTHAVRYYDNEGLVPNVMRGPGNARFFSEFNVGWLRVVHCLRVTGLSITGIKHYIDLCAQGDETLENRCQIISAQEAVLQQQIDDLNHQIEILQYKKKYHIKLLEEYKKKKRNSQQ